jgi:hypothetical protein
MFRKMLQNNLGDGAVAQAQPRAERSSQGPVGAPGRDSSRGAPASPASEPGVGDDGGRSNGFSISTLIIWGVLIFGGIWLIRRLFASRRAPGAGPGGYPGRGHPGQQPGHGDPRYGDPNAGYGYGYGRGGGFGSGLGGGLLGGLLGGWLGGHVFGRGGGGQAYGGDNTNAADSAGAGHLPQQDPGAFADDQGPEFAGSGGSFGADDFGGGDSGSGGDF